MHTKLERAYWISGIVVAVVAILGLITRQHNVSSQADTSLHSPRSVVTGSGNIVVQGSNNVVGLPVPVVPPTVAPKADSTETTIAPQFVRAAIEELLSDCENGYREGRKADDIALLPGNCYAKKSDVSTVRAFWEPPGSPEKVEFRLLRLNVSQQTIATGVVSRTAVLISGDHVRKIDVMFGKTPAGWRIMKGNIFAQ